MKKTFKEKCVEATVSALTTAANKMAAHSLNEMSIATWYQPKIDEKLLRRNLK